MTPEDKETLDAYRKGEHLSGIVDSPAWGVLLEILQDEVEQSEKKLLSASTNDEGEILALHHRARAQRDLFNELKNTVDNLIEFANNPPAIVNSTRPY
jgi:hypothetical protein